MVFTDETAEIEVNDSPIPALKLKQLKERFRQDAKKRALSSVQIKTINDLLAPQG
jgi:hypothetical protein